MLPVALLRRVASAALAVSAVIATSTVSAQATPRTITSVDTGVVLLECRIGTVASAVVEGRAQGDSIFVARRAILALASLDTARAAGMISLAAAATLLRTEVAIDTSALTVVFADSGSLPVSRRAARARLRERLREREADRPAPTRQAPLHGAPSAMTAQYAFAGDGSAEVDAMSRVAGGALALATRWRRPEGAHASVAWETIPAVVSAAPRLRIGAIDELAGRVGLRLSNAPLAHLDSLRLASVEWRASPGTELEVYDDGVPVAAESVGSGGVARIAVAERHGPHVFSTVVHDPEGHDRVITRVVAIPEALLPRGALRYAVAAGACSRVSCVPFFARVAGAPSDAVTLGAALLPVRVPGARAAPALVTTLDARVASALTLAVRRGEDPHSTLELRLARGANSAIVLRSAGADVASGPMPLLASPRQERVTSILASVGGDRRGALTVVAAAARSRVVTSITGGAANPFGSLQATLVLARVDAGVADPALRPSVLAAWRFSALVSPSRLRWLPRSARASVLRLSAARSFDDDGASVHAALALPATSALALELSAAWSGLHATRAVSRPALSLSVRRRVAGVATARTELGGGARSAAARSVLTGSVLFDALRRRVDSSAEPADGSAAVHGYVFVDRNRNGRRDPGEEGVAGALVRGGDLGTVTDTSGVYFLTGVPPDQLLALAVDPVSVEDASLEPGVALSVIVTAATVVRVDIPVTPRDRAADQGR